MKILSKRQIFFPKNLVDAFTEEKVTTLKLEAGKSVFLEKIQKNSVRSKNLLTPFLYLQQYSNDWQSVHSTTVGFVSCVPTLM